MSREGLVAEDGMRLSRVAAAVGLLTVIGVLLPAVPVARAQTSRTLELCCAWGRALEDGRLSYSLSGADPATADVMRAAIRAWDDSLPTISLFEVPPTKAKIDIRIEYLEGTGDSEGLAVTSFTRRGLIRHVELRVDAPRAPAGAGAVEQITKHEVGHALGLRHANFEGDLMSPIVNPTPGPMSACDIAGVVEANRWQTTDGARRPQPPSATHVPC
jgi:hypothetical protein